MGLSFFDFKWDKLDSFSVVNIMHQLDKPAVIKTLHTDLGLLLMKSLSANDEAMLIAGSDTLSRFPVNNGYAYYTRSANRIRAIEYSGKSRIISIRLEGDGHPARLPSSIIFTHHRAHFSIALKKLQQDEQ